MRKIENNYAFIDSQNINLGIRELGWRLDFRKLRIYLQEKYAAQKAHLFIGYLPENKNLYLSLERYGYMLVFKEVVRNNHGTVKGNVDAELVLQTMIDYEDYDKAIIVSGDGDFACLAHYLGGNKKLEAIIVPDQKKYSGLLKRASEGKVYFLSKAKANLEYLKIKSPA